MISARLSQNAALIEEALKTYLSDEDVDFAEELEAERYSIFARAKRIRPTLVLEFCRLFGGRDEAALPFACAVEMVHTYSLIHDDLPCMDDDDLRRGRPTCHKVYGEATALLAGDGLLTRAFGTLASNTAVPAESVRAAVAALARAAGSFGMIGGQVIDLAGEKKKLSLDTLKKLHAHKTGAMITVSAELGCLAAGLDADDPRTVAACRFAEGIGLAFQIVDDVLDVTADVALLGKPIGSDAENEKTTFLTYYTPDEALALAGALTERAKEALADIPNTQLLQALADYLVSRKH
ncbi:MAG: polyprenyl synthetase family protein [Ruminococcaceae bacterium]|nr:polyprenyl synthetase family protein [Oscillospiraceae bacterium]